MQEERDEVAFHADSPGICHSIAPGSVPTSGKSYPMNLQTLDAALGLASQDAPNYEDDPSVDAISHEPPEY